MRLNLILIFIFSSAISGCAAPSKYYWGTYEGTLYASYKDPSKAAELSASLEEIITTSEKTNKPVAPGIYAEYGFMLHQQGKSREAIPYFEKEKRNWPESGAFMDSMIKVASTKPHTSAIK